METETLKGSCLCHAVQYEVTGVATRFYHCHCQRCRKATGTGHASNLMLTPEDFRWIKGEDSIITYKVPEAERFRNCFCEQCGSPMPRVINELNIVLIPAGTLDAEPEIQPQARIFWDSRADWSCSGVDLPVYAEYEKK